MISFSESSFKKKMEKFVACIFIDEKYGYYLKYWNILSYRLAVHYLYLSDNPLQTHISPRGSLPSIRKASYDLKSIISEGTQPIIKTLYSLNFTNLE